jgi:Avian adenovirus fibre, N-terminal
MATTQIRGYTQILNDSVRTAQIDIDADFDIQTHKLTNVTNPSNPQDAATKDYVDSALASVASSGHVVRAATTGNITLSGTQTVDGVSLSVNDRVLVRAQSTSANNGIYVVQSGSWTRATDMDAWAEVPGGIISVEEGSTLADTVWLSTADLGGTLGSTSITFVQLPGPSDILAGAGLTRTGQTIDVIAGDNSLTVSANDVIVKRDSAGAISISGSGIAVAVDGSTIEISSNQLRVKPGGIGETQLGAGVYQLTANIITRETPSGSINGSNTTFTLANTPISGSEHVYLNGILQEPGAGNDYTISGATITYLSAPLTGDRLRVSYRK